MKAERVSFRYAVELLVNDSIPLAASSAPPPKHATVRKLPTVLTRDVEDAKLLIQVIEYYHETLLQSPEALDYLKSRGIGSEEAIKTFKLGFANRTLGYRLPASTRVEGAALRGQLQRLGLYRGSGHEHFSGSIVITAYLLNQAGYRDSTAYIINTTPAQEANILSDLQSYPNNKVPPVPGVNSADTCGSRTNHALRRGNMFDSSNPHGPLYSSPLPETSAIIASFYAKATGGSVIGMPMGTTTLPSIINQFNSH